MKLRNVFGVLLLLIVLTACEIETEELVEVNQPKASETDIADYADDSEGRQLTQEEIDEIEIDKEIDRAFEEAQIDEDYELVRELEDLEARKQTGEATRGSCNSITESSVCMAYYGAFWSEAQMKLNCRGAGVFSTNPCPRESVGGCNIGNGGPSDMVSWFYNTGGSPMGDSLESAINVCNMNPMGRWINAK